MCKHNLIKKKKHKKGKKSKNIMDTVSKCSNHGEFRRPELFIFHAIAVPNSPIFMFILNADATTANATRITHESLFIFGTYTAKDVGNCTP